MMPDKKDTRITAEIQEKIWELREEYPQDYESDSAVIRAGVMVLYRWKKRGVNYGRANELKRLVQD